MSIIKSIINKIFKARYMATEKLAGDTIKDIYNTASNNYFFVKERTKKYSIISPYYIITDGHDVCGFLDNNANFQIGSSFIIKKKGIFSPKKSQKLFEAIIEQATKAHFVSNFDAYYIKDNKEVRLSLDDFSIHNTKTAIYSSPFINDFHVIHPILFLVLPNDKKIKLNKSIKFVTVIVSNEDCFLNGSCVNSDNYVTKIIGFLTSNKEINLPIISGSNKWQESI